MPTTCHRCGAALDEGTSFCPACGAPQIRVNADANMPATPPVPTGTPGNLQPPATPVAMAPTPLDWTSGLKAAALMGLLAGIPSSIRLVSLGCCLWVVGGGALAVMLYQKWKPGGIVTAGMGSRLGAVTGFFAFAFWFLFNAAAQAAKGMNEFRAELGRQMQEAAARNPDPNAQRMIEQMSTPGGIAVFLTLMIVVMLLAFIVFGVIGGAVGASIWGKRQQS